MDTCGQDVDQGRLQKEMGKTPDDLDAKRVKPQTTFIDSKVHEITSSKSTHSRMKLSYRYSKQAL